MTRIFGSSVTAIVLGAIVSAAAVQERRMRVPQLQTPITAKYLQLGADRGVLGGPDGNERPTPDGVGRFRHFERGSPAPTYGRHHVKGHAATCGRGCPRRKDPPAPLIGWQTAETTVRCRTGGIESYVSGIAMCPPRMIWLSSLEERAVTGHITAVPGLE